MDDPLFVWTAQHIAGHPLDPYGFRVVWYSTETPIADVTKNPPLASYYAALFGTLFGWSERVLHWAFLLPALAVILGTYALASRFTRVPLLAAGATLAAPGFLVSGTTVMCDVLMLALWIFALILWLEGTASGKNWQFAVAALLIAASALTKYFGIALIPLLATFSIIKKRRLDPSLAYLAIPALLLVLYQHWTHRLYGRGLLSDAVQYASLHNRGHEIPLLVKTLVGLAFAGGCFLPALFFALLLWSRRGILIALAFCCTAGLATARYPSSFEAPLASSRWPLISALMVVFLLGGISAVALAGSGWRNINAERALLSLWLVGTFLFATFVNWTVNARSILPMVPAAAILVVLRLEAAGFLAKPRFQAKAGAALMAAAAMTLWVVWADSDLANTGREAAYHICEQLRPSQASIYFEGHWGFQYYMQQLGTRAADIRKSPFRAGDIVIIPENATNSFGPPPGFMLGDTTVTNFDLRGSLATMSQPAGAGFYSSVWGPLPFTFAKLPPERYLLAKLVPLPENKDPAPLTLGPRSGP
jgi:4-amino-4-deoxy-L-arabinose transferase-like glycosyltransferase